MKERIQQALAYNKLSVNKLSQLIGMNQTTLNNQIRGEAVLTSSTIEKIMEHLSNISAEWLLTGKGDMKQSSIRQIIGRIGSCGDGDIFQAVNDNQEEYKAQIENLEAQIVKLEADKERLLAIIDRLTSK